ncbi:MAG: 50S ribosomal protein L25 [Planctomycetota bacterium]
MTKALVLKAEKRTQAGSKDAARIRRQKRIPAIIYGHKQESAAITLDLHDFTESLHHGNRLFDIKVDGKTEKLMVKNLQYDHLGRQIIHADLIRVSLTEKVTVTVPIELKGDAKGTHEGGIIEEHADHIEVSCRVTDLPEKISVSVKDVGIGDSLYAGNIVLPAGIELVSPSNLVIVTCHLVAAAVSTEQLEEEMPSAPEVIGEKPSEEEPSPEQGS